MRAFVIWLLLVVAGTAIAWGVSRPRRGTHLSTARTFLPCMAPMALLATSLGLWDRRRLRSGARHASPSISWLAKRGAMAAFAAAAVWACSPVLWPAWSFYLACAAGSACVGVYVAHLPARW